MLTLGIAVLPFSAAHAAWDGSPYDPNETLDPECTPAQTDCTVSLGFTVSNGKVGIGTSTPYAPLSIVGQAVGNYFTATSTTQASTFPYASTTAITVTGVASTSNLIVSNSFTLANITGFLKATAGVVATALIDLANDVTGVLTVTNGGTGWSNLTSGALLYGNGTSAIGTTTTGTPGYVLSYQNGVPTWVATSTLANISGVLPVLSGGTGSTTLSGILKGNGTSQVATAVSGIDYESPLSFSYPLIRSSNAISSAFGTTTSNNWSNLQTFTSGLISSASSTAGDGTQAGGLTISGGATTTGNAYFAAKIGVGTSNPISPLDISSTSPELRLTDTDAGTTFRHFVLNRTDTTFAINRATEADPNSLNSFFKIDQGFSNFSVGASAGNVGSGILAIGFQAGKVNTANHNTFIGQQTGLVNTTGTDNIFLGNSSGISNVDGSDNIFGGELSGNSNVSGNGNLFLGQEAGRLNTGSNNIYLGDKAGRSGTSGSFNIVFGQSVLPASLSASQQLNIGNVLYGTGLYDASSGLSSNPISAGRIGIGTTTPWRALSVVGSSDLGTNALAGNFTATSSIASVLPYASSTSITVTDTGFFGRGSFINALGTTTIATGQGFTIGSSQFVLQQGSGNVGIGTNSPSQKLVVQGDYSSSVDAKQILIQGNADSNKQLEIGFHTGNNYGSIQAVHQGTGFSPLLINPAGGNVGIGRIDPIYVLDVKNSATSPNAPMIAITDPTNNRYAAGIGLNDATRMSFYSGETAGNGTPLGSTHERMVITTGGSVGIASTSPWKTFSVMGTVAFDGLTGSTGAGSLCLDSGKQVVYNSASDNCLPSLRDTKHDIRMLNINALEQILALEPVSFAYINDPSNAIRYGFIAEDAAAVDPHFATYDISGDISGIDDRSLIAAIVKGFESIVERIVSLEEIVSNYTRSFVTDEVQTNRLCVGSACVTEAEFIDLLQRNQVASPEPLPSPIPPDEPAPESVSSEPPPAEPEPEVALEIVQEVIEGE